MFLVTISILEILQWATGLLGSFDIDDILTNALGVTVGYMAQRWVPRPKDTSKGIGKIFVAAALLSVVTIASVQGVNHWIAKAYERLAMGYDSHGNQEPPIAGGKLFTEFSMVQLASLLGSDNRWVNAQRIEVSGGQNI